MSQLENKTSRTLSLVLRHDPGSIGLSLDEKGWANVEELIEAMNRNKKPVDHDLLKRVVENNSQKRFSFSEDGLRVRANEGHSVPISLEMEEKPPPKFLYHGTTTRWMDLIEQQGLKKMKRSHVHLFVDPRDAHEVGNRQGKPTILEIPTKVMLDHGFKFYEAENGDWLIEEVPPDYLNRQFTL